MNNKKTTCCFTGHRPPKLLWGYDEENENCIRFKLKLMAEIEAMRKKGVTTFLTGMAQGTDIFAAEAVLALKRAYPSDEIRLTAVIPHEGQANRWSTEYRERYFNILAAADSNILLNSRYTNGCMQQRNRYLVDNSAHIIAVFNGAAGGTKYTVEYARKKGLDIILLNPNDLSSTTVSDGFAFASGGLRDF